MSFLCPVCGLVTYCLRVLGVSERVCPPCLVWFHDTLADMVRFRWLLMEPLAARL